MVANPSERIMIFIDGSNFYHGLKQEFGSAKIDMGKLVDKLCDGRRLMRVYYYNAPVGQQDDSSRYRGQQAFFYNLRRIPYFEVKLGRLERRGDSFVEKGVDIKMAVDMLHLAHQNTYDTAILVSGDGDFAYVVEAIKYLGKHVENAFVRVGRSRALSDACDRLVSIDGAYLNGILTME